MWRRFCKVLESAGLSALVQQVTWTPPAARMASYFEEHDCEPTDPEEQYHQNALLELAR